MKVLITGAAGFLGSHLCEYFLKKGFDVVGVDNFITGTPENLSSYTDRDNFSFIEHDVIEPFPFPDDFDLILHFACPASPVDYLKHPLRTMKVDSIGTLNMLELARKSDAIFVFASTSEVYGDPAVHPQTEDYWGNVNPTGSRSVYDEAKRFSEALTMAYHRKYGLDVRLPRIFNTYGPRMQLDDGRVVPNFIIQALKGQDLTVHGDGLQTRSFCYVDDLIQGLFRFSTREGLSGEILNMGNPEEYRIIDFARIVVEITGSNSQIIYFPLPEDDPKQRCPDIRKAQKLLDWHPQTPLDDGLGKTLHFFKSKIRVK
ncbi:MAG TPA: SDR family oxidoreductase [Methanobacterium sp.]|jgi:nucleoside-diphosphate-sugar epimerase|nr:SDR family oxidoreductase [Methanobacterium sp.]HOI40261.1 SDR family oxidoreductase [Methanobacterium sp.]